MQSLSYKCTGLARQGVATLLPTKGTKFNMARHVNKCAVFTCRSSNLDKNTSEDEWKKLLTDAEYYVLREKGTERAGTGEYDKHFQNGVYSCAGCGTALYNSTMKFNSGCGWPAFDDNLPDTVERHEDVSFGMKRVEITCKNCGGHLGHVFEGEGFTPTNERHCVNSVSIKFTPSMFGSK